MVAVWEIGGGRLGGLIAWVGRLNLAGVSFFVHVSYTTFISTMYAHFDPDI